MKIPFEMPESHPLMDAVFAAADSKRNFLLTWENGEYVKFTGRVFVEMDPPFDPPDDTEATASGHVTDVIIDQRGSVYDRRGSDECEPWI
jgi:hypothetical protein